VERIHRIKEKLSVLGIDYDSQKASIKEYLLEIEAHLETVEAIKNYAVETLQTVPPTLVSVSKALACSRTTFYNNDILKQYIEYSARLMAQDNPFSQKEEILRQKRIADKKVSLMETRDIQSERLHHECKAFQDMLAAKEKEISRLQQRIRELTQLRK
jgi:hypothetical protein